MNIPAIRDAIAARLSETIDNAVVSCEYTPVVEVDGTQTAIIVQPVSVAVDFADRAQRAIEPKIAVTVSRLLGQDRQGVGDAILSVVGEVIAALHGASFSGAVCRSAEISDPILSEDSISGGNAASSRITLTLYGQELR